MAQSKFKFTGDVSLPKAESKRPFCKVFTKDGQEMISINLGIMESKNNMGFVELFGSVPKNNVIKTMNTDGEKIEINFDDRFDKNVIKSVANYRKYVVDLGDDFGGKMEFITPYDACMYLKDNLPLYKGKICVTGQMEKQWYQDKYYDKFKAQNVYAVDEEHKNRLSITTDIYYRSDCVDKSDYKEEKKIYIDGYILQYIDKNEGNKFIPQRFVFSAAKYNLENEHHKKLLAYKKKYIEPSTKKWIHLLWEIVMINGAEEVDFDESQLTDAQKEQIELGIRTLEDFRPNGAIFGERAYEYRLLEPSLIKVSDSEDFSGGFIDCELTNSEFEEQIYQPAKNEKMSDVIEKSEKKSKKEEKEEVEEEESIDVEIEDEDDDELF